MCLRNRKFAGILAWMMMWSMTIKPLPGMLSVWGQDAEVLQFDESDALQPDVLQSDAVQSDAAAANTPALQENELYARAAVLIDGSSGRVLFGKQENVRLPMASTTKIMTCILALEYGDMHMECEVSQRAAAAPKVKLGASAGRKFVLEDLLYSLMLESHNDAAIMIAEAVSGSVEGFAVLMNQKAESIGLTDTAFVTPNGLDADGHYTTARELALLLRYCITESPKRGEFLTITQRQSYTFSDLDGVCTYTANNHNAFLTMMDGALTGKTGFTGKAGYCYVGALEKDGMLLIAALLACGWPGNRSYKWHDTKLLMKYGLENFRMEEQAIDSGLPEEIAVKDGAYDWAGGEDCARVRIKSDCPARKSWLLKDGEAPKVRVSLPKEIGAPAAAGDVVGTVQIWIGEQCMEEYPVTLLESVIPIDWKWYLRQMAKSWLPG